MKAEKVRITWNGTGGELDSVTVRQTDDEAVSDALADMVSGKIVFPGDSFTVESVE